MANQTRQKKFWKPPSFEDFNILLPNKKFKLDQDDVERKPVPKEVAEPKTVSELATHPKKIEEVKNWLKRSLSLKAPILFITGPAGCGKTITIKLLAKEEGMQVKEWINPINKTEHKAEAMVENDIYDKFNFIETNQIDKFVDFIFKSSRYNCLFGNEKPILLLVKDIPNIFIWRPKSFHDFLENYINRGKSPIVFVLTDDQNLNLSCNLFPDNVKSKCNITKIKFNPVNHGSLMKNLKMFCDIYCSENVSFQFLEEISKNSGGDLRSALNDLVLLLRTTGLNLNPNCKKLKSIKKDEGCTVTKMLSSKNLNFDFYHVIGRILYPKLLTEKDKLNCANPKQVFLHDVRTIADNLSGSYLCILHENYLQTYTKLQGMVEGADCFSFCDVLQHHEELEDYKRLIGVITLMLKNTAPRKTGFKPIKKSFRFDKTDEDYNWEINECFKLNSSKRDILLDVMPYAKFLNINNKGSKELIGVSKDCDEADDVVEIEEFDD